MSNVERIYYMLQENDCNHWFRDNADTLRLAEYLDRKGVIVPPCKVGDTVYVVYHKKVISGEVRLIRPFISKKETIFKGNIVCEVDNIFLEDGSKEEIELYVVFEKPYGIERIAYLTKEEAEQALKGGVQE